MGDDDDDFFKPPPPREVEPTSLSTPEWAGPPHATLPGIVALEQVIASNDEVAVYVAGADAYPTGISLRVFAAFRDEGVEPETHLFGPGAEAGSEIAAEKLRLGVQFADGSRVTNLDWARAQDRDEERKPRGPLMTPRGGSSGRGRWRHSYWIWPLPPPGSMQLVCEWPAHGIPLTRVEIDTQPLRDAASRARRLFES